MKFLIWFLCFLIFGSIMALCAVLEFSLGGIPTALLAFGTFWLARKLCKLWDISKKVGRTQKPAPAPARTHKQPSEASAEEAKPEKKQSQIEPQSPTEPLSATNAERTQDENPCSARSYKTPFIACAAVAGALLIAIIVLSTCIASLYSNVKDMKSQLQEQENEIVMVQDAAYEQGFKEGYCNGYRNSVSDYANPETRTEFLRAFLSTFRQENGEMDWDGLYDWILARRKYLFGK